MAESSITLAPKITVMRNGRSIGGNVRSTKRVVVSIGRKQFRRNPDMRKIGR